MKISEKYILSVVRYNVRTQILSKKCLICIPDLWDCKELSPEGCFKWVFCIQLEKYCFIQLLDVMVKNLYDLYNFVFLF